MRHGHAVSKNSDDIVRPLSNIGRNESRKMARWLHTQSANIERVLVSPYLRTKQTLHIVQAYLTLPNDHEVLIELTPNGNCKIVSCYLWTLANQGVNQVLLISHLPLVAHLVQDLCSGEQAPIFNTSTITRVDLDVMNGNGKLCWTVAPSQLLRKLGEY
ncbi:Phosphohistidine phosphatase SixA [Candidatus Steffania adelgidicola]|nr:Phosphohistidine phosphatase SixA [Candidatus Steffania adelgidicola]